MTDIIGFEACTQELKRLLDEIAENIKASGEKGSDELHAAVLTETRKLVEFTNRTEPKDFFDADEVKNIRKIDQAADEARREIFGGSAHAIISHMQDGISQLNQLEKAVRQQAAENEREAKKIRLIPIRKAIDAVTETVGAVKGGMEALSDDSSDEAVVKSKIESVLRAIAALDKAAKKLFEHS
ncbi:MAG: hypothetical protein JRJ85_12760 [Deltaproteobacteria bacterium]|nr:hypothetical protein [Deltaproteobacteria bacterium]